MAERDTRCSVGTRDTRAQCLCRRVHTRRYNEDLTNEMIYDAIYRNITVDVHSPSRTARFELIYTFCTDNSLYVQNITCTSSICIYIDTSIFVVVYKKHSLAVFMYRVYTNPWAIRCLLHLPGLPRHPPLPVTLPAVLSSPSVRIPDVYCQFVRSRVKFHGFWFLF